MRLCQREYENSDTDSMQRFVQMEKWNQRGLVSQWLPRKWPLKWRLTGKDGDQLGAALVIRRTPKRYGDLYSARSWEPHPEALRYGSYSFYTANTPYLPLPRRRSPDGAVSNSDNLTLTNNICGIRANVVRLIYDGEMIYKALWMSWVGLVPLDT